MTDGGPSRVSAVTGRCLSVVPEAVGPLIDAGLPPSTSHSAARSAGPTARMVRRRRRHTARRPDTDAGHVPPRTRSTAADHDQPPRRLKRAAVRWRSPRALFAFGAVGLPVNLGGRWLAVRRPVLHRLITPTPRGSIGSGANTGRTGPPVLKNTACQAASAAVTGRQIRHGCRPRG